MTLPWLGGLGPPPGLDILGPGSQAKGESIFPLPSQSAFTVAGGRRPNKQRATRRRVLREVDEALMGLNWLNGYGYQRVVSQS